MSILTKVEYTLLYAFGIKSSADELQKVMAISLAGLKGIGIFQDNLIVAGTTIEEYNIQLRINLTFPLWYI